MPIYEYQCSNCHHTFDLIQKMSDEPVTICPACTKASAVRLVSAAGFQLKGTGWYATDFKTKTPSDKSTTTKTKTTETASATSDTGSSASDKPSTASTSVTNKDE